METNGPDSDVPAGRGRSRVFAHLNQNAGGILYGVVLAAAATAIVSVRPAKSSYVVGSILLMLLVYSLAHLKTLLS